MTVPPLEFRERVLPNGLRVVSLEDHTSPTVSVQVWYMVGGRDDPPGRSGFAHLFEHLMFKSTKYLKAEQFDRLMGTDQTYPVAHDCDSGRHDASHRWFSKRLATVPCSCLRAQFAPHRR